MKIQQATWQRGDAVEVMGCDYTGTIISKDWTKGRVISAGIKTVTVKVDDLSVPVTFVPDGITQRIRPAASDNKIISFATARERRKRSGAVVADLVRKERDNE